MKILSILLSTFFSFYFACRPAAAPKTTAHPPPLDIVVGAERFDQYLPLLKGKRVALVVNPTSVVNEGKKSYHLVDALLSKKVDVRKVFAPEHGFRGEADAGEQVKNGKDKTTGLSIISLYGKNKKPTPEQLKDVDIVIFDIQDVGARFYTYISTMHYVMEACAEQGKYFIVLDRPNPNGHYVDGPLLSPSFSSFVGMHPIPIVHGNTVGELARMINEERWLANKKQCKMSVILCDNYTHNTPYELPIKPSPNLPNSLSVYLYPSLCLFEGTIVSVGRGTNKQFQCIGAPEYDGKMPYEFTPVSSSGAKQPLYENKICYGLDLSPLNPQQIRDQKQLQLHWLINLYKQCPLPDNFFNADGFFDKLAGGGTLRWQIKQNMSEEEIRSSWQKDLETYKQMRKKYLLYDDFE